MTMASKQLTITADTEMSLLSASVLWSSSEIGFLKTIYIINDTKSNSDKRKPNIENNYMEICWFNPS